MFALFVVGILGVQFLVFASTKTALVDLVINGPFTQGQEFSIYTQNTPDLTYAKLQLFFDSKPVSITRQRSNKIEAIIPKDVNTEKGIIELKYLDQIIDYNYSLPSPYH